MYLGHKCTVKPAGPQPPKCLRGDPALLPLPVLSGSVWLVSISPSLLLISSSSLCLPPCVSCRTLVIGSRTYDCKMTSSWDSYLQRSFPQRKSPSSVPEMSGEHALRGRRELGGASCDPCFHHRLNKEILSRADKPKKRLLIIFRMMRCFFASIVAVFSFSSLPCMSQWVLSWLYLRCRQETAVVCKKLTRREDGLCPQNSYAIIGLILQCECT